MQVSWQNGKTMKTTKSLFRIKTSVAGVLTPAIIIGTCLLPMFAGCSKSNPAKDNNDSLPDAAVTQTLTAKNTSEARLNNDSLLFPFSSPEAKDLLLRDAQNMLRHVSTPDSIHIVKVPGNPSSFTIKGVEAETYSSLLAQVKRRDDIQSILGLISFFSTNFPHPNWEIHEGTARSALTELLQTDYYVTVKSATNATGLPLFLLSLEGRSGSAPTTVTLRQFQREPDGRFTATWSPRCYASWIFCGASTFMEAVKADVDKQLDRFSGQIASKVRLGEQKDEDANDQIFRFASNAVAQIVLKCEKDGDHYARVATAPYCISHMNEAMAAYEGLDEGGRFPGTQEQIITALFPDNIAGQGRPFGSIPMPALRPDAEQKALPVNTFPAPWALELFQNISVLTCPLSDGVFSALPPLKYAKAQDLFISAEKDRAVLGHMQASRLAVPLIYCPYHHMLGFKDGSFCCLGSNADLTEYLTTVPPLSVRPLSKVLDGEKSQPKIQCEYFGGTKVFPTREPISSTGLFKEVMNVFLQQEVLLTTQLTEEFALSAVNDEKTKLVVARLAQENVRLRTEVDKAFTVESEQPYEELGASGLTAADGKAIDAEAEQNRRLMDQFNQMLEQSSKPPAQ